MSHHTLKFEDGTLKTFQRIKYCVTLLQDTSMSLQMYKQAFMEI